MATRTGTENIEKIAVFAFGVVFLITILVLVLLNPTPTTAQFFVFRLILALSAAGVGALLPGLLRMELKLPLQGGIRAGGALALFASVWFVNPASLGIEVQPPKEDAGVLINRFLNLTNERDHKTAYSLYSKHNKDRISLQAYESMGKQVRDPLGAVGKRVLVSTDTPDMINGVRGPFVIHTYQTLFASSKAVWLEIASTVPESGAWRIHGYNIARCEAPFCTPIASMSP